MQAFKTLGLLVLAALLAVVAMILIKVSPRITEPMPTSIASFEECVAAGNPVMESYPRQCRTKDGIIFVEDSNGTFPTQLPDENMSSNGCVVTGCSGQLCVSLDEAQDTFTTCEYRAEYTCYAEASCEPQTDGKCGWTSTPELTQCLASPPSSERETKFDLEVM